MTAFAGIDVGTSGVRCLIVDERGGTLAAGSRTWSYVTDEAGFPVLDPEPTLAAVRDAIGQALAATDARVAAAGVTSQRSGVAFLDVDGARLWVGPNADGRAAGQGIELERAHGEAIYRIAGRLPAMLYLPARLAWIRETRPDWDVASALPLSDWVVHALTGARCTEPTQAAELLVYDVARGTWSDELLDALGVPRALLPELLPAGVPAGEVLDGWPLPSGTPVVPAGADTQCASLAAGGRDPGDVVVVAGTTMLVQQLREDALPDPRARTWRSPFPIAGRFVHEVHCGEAGALVSWLAAILGVGVDVVAEEAATAPVGAGGVSVVDPAPNAAADFALTRHAGIAVPAPVLALGRSRADIARATFEGIAFAARAALEWLEEGSAATSLRTAGGVARSRVFVEALAATSGRPVRAPSTSDASALGAAIVAAAGHHGGVGSAAAAMADAGVEVAPAHVDEYAAAEAAWRERLVQLDTSTIRMRGIL